jgi:hypothetical protein
VSRSEDAGERPARVCHTGEAGRTPPTKERKMKNHEMWLMATGIWIIASNTTHSETSAAWFTGIAVLCLVRAVFEFAGLCVVGLIAEFGKGKLKEKAVEALRNAK